MGRKHEAHIPEKGFNIVAIDRDGIPGEGLKVLANVATFAEAKALVADYEREGYEVGIWGPDDPGSGYASPEEEAEEDAWALAHGVD
jgi:hypothetical protein